MTFDDSGYCLATFSTPLRAFAPLTISLSSVAFQALIWVSEDKTYSTTANYTTLSSVSAVATPLYVAWEASDLSLFPIAYATSLAKSFNIPFTPTPSPGTPSPGTSSTLPKETGLSSSSGLSTGAKAGIGVGAVLGAALVMGIAIVCLYLRRRKRKNAVAVPDSDLPEATKVNAEGLYDVEQYHSHQRWSELAATHQISELNAMKGPEEMDANDHSGDMHMTAAYMVPDTPAELEADEHGKATQGDISSNRAG